MKYFNKPKINDEIFIIIELTFQKSVKIVVPEDPYGKRKKNMPFLELSKTVTADVSSLRPAYLKKVG